MTRSHNHQGFEPEGISTRHPSTDSDSGGALYTLAGDSPAAPPVRPYDFKRPERISQDQLRSLKSLHETFARSYGGQLTGMSRMIVDMEIESAEQISYAEYISGLGHQTCFATVRAPELGGRLVLEMSQQVFYPLIERLLGGDVNGSIVPDRALTSIETRLARSVFHRAMQPLHEAWSGLRAVNFTIENVESNPQIAQIVSPNEVVLAVRFRVGLAGGSGSLSLCLPYALIETLIDDLGTRSWTATGEPLDGGSHHAPAVREHLSDAPVELSAVLASTSITLSELRSMQPGDVILTGVSTRTPATICVEGRSKFKAAQGQHAGRRAVQVLGPDSPSSR
ncbi:MAG: flagellar motor switch protein FliM [Phycisphaerae bacterium]|nr:flagellar motor switch protein FliM [Phycisphaerae bacterium]|tara:strand:- start:1156 stop:2169 length:1014 start_codon:yes stop_codon:yes gene_type:complete